MRRSSIHKLSEGDDLLRNITTIERPCDDPALGRISVSGLMRMLSGLVDQPEDRVRPQSMPEICLEIA
jgi:hypothetical protein